MKQTNIMTPNHLNWDEFTGLLRNAMYLDAYTGICRTKPHTYSRSILRRHFPEIDEEKTIEFFKQNGDYGDFEIGYNGIQFG